MKPPKFEQAHDDILEVASQHRYALTDRDREVVDRILRRLSKWQERGRFLTYREARVLERIGYKLASLIEAHRKKHRPPLPREAIHEKCQALLQELGLAEAPPRKGAAKA